MAPHHKKKYCSTVSPKLQKKTKTPLKKDKDTTSTARLALALPVGSGYGVSGSESAIGANDGVKLMDV